MSRIAVVHYKIPNNVADDNINNYIRNHAGVGCKVIECRESDEPKIKARVQFGVDFECHEEDIDETVSRLKLSLQEVKFVTKVFVSPRPAFVEGKL
jgi:hypothetical protein